MAVPSFRVGAKELFLPRFSISLLRTGGLPANFARFHVPLWFSKLDLRDYLWHGYGVDVLAVRSYVKQSRVQQGRPGQERPAPRRWHRPRSQKFMTVELVRPFVWPAEPEDYGSWNQREARDAEKFAREAQELASPIGDTRVDVKNRSALREQARELLSGRARWAPSAYRGATFGSSRGVGG